LRVAQTKVLQELSTQIAEERTQNRLDFFASGGDEAQDFFQSVQNKFADLPRHFIAGEVEVSEELLGHIKEFTTFKQTAIDQKFEREVATLHRNAIKSLRTAKMTIPAELIDSWQGWVRWLGHSPCGMMHTSMDGAWRYSSEAGEFDLHLSSSGKKVLVIGEDRIETEGLVEITGLGEMILRHEGDAAFGLPWKLKWYGDRLEGKDSLGGKRVLRLQAFDYGVLLKQPKEPGEMTEDNVEEKSQVEEMFEDPQVVELTKNYYKALEEKIETLESGYLRLLNSSLESFREKDDEIAAGQVEDELARVAAINWRSGFMQLTLMQSPGKMPSDLRRKQEVFQMEFKKRFEPLQRTYRLALEKMLRERKARRNPKLGDIEKALEKLKIPEGMVYARYVKIESLEDEGVEHATIAVVEIIGHDGKNLPYKDFSDAKASSFEKKGDNGGERGPDKAINGNPKNFWHSEWRESRASFPHWISFNLGAEHLIKGFRIVPRYYQKNRGTDVIRWRFHVSDDGKNWTVVATGNFPKGNHTKEHLGFAKEK